MTAIRKTTIHKSKSKTNTPSTDKQNKTNQTNSKISQIN